MQFSFHSTVILLALLTGVDQGSAQGQRFFRISGPAATTIAGFRADGMMIWSNGLPGSTYTIQTASSLSGGANWVDYVQIPSAQPLNTNQLVAFDPPRGMNLVPDGSFVIGDTLDGESDAIPTNVTVSAFYLDVNLVSYRQWQSVYSWATNHGYLFDYPGSGKAADQPVQTVDWWDAVKWCNARSQQAGFTPVYYTDAGLSQVYSNGQATPFVNWSTNGFRLPTEAEWEKAARGGLSGQRFPWGNVISEVLANYQANSIFPYDLGPSGYNSIGTLGGASPATSPVGSFPPNGYGLYDMAGNVLEWCWDWYDSSPASTGSPYAGGTDPRGPASSPSGKRVLRGGAWIYFAVNARCANRGNNNYPSPPFNFVGFRCARGL